MPVYVSPFMPVDNTNANKVMVVGDLSAYVIAERQSLSVIVDPINLVGSNETQIFIRSRAGGGIWNTDAIRIGIV
jgi:HK97 family phage major capsid protein